MDVEKRIGELEKKVAALEVQAQEQPKERFIPEDSYGKHYNDKEKMTLGEYLTRNNI